MVEPMTDDDDERWICASCISEPFLSAAVEDAGDVQTCSFCDQEGPAISVEELADRVETAFETHFYRTAKDPTALEYTMMRDPEGSYDWEREGEPVALAIADAAGVSEEIAEEVQELLDGRFSDFDAASAGDETEFDGDSHHERKGPNNIEFQLEWVHLERSLKSETRFFNKAASGLLERIFAGIADYHTNDGGEVIRFAGPGTALASFIRARVFHSSEALDRAFARPDLELGPPPSKVARAGRMNPRGISFYYGATDVSVALAEVRPPVGSRTLVGHFEIVRTLRLLDIDALRSVFVDGSVFDGGYIGRLELAKFLKSLAAKMTMPVMPDDEPSEYLITQVIADYLASRTELALDGILYPSVQQGGDGQNVVLFREASRVAELDLPTVTEIAIHLESFDNDGPSPDYWVSEKVPLAVEPAPASTPKPFWSTSFHDPFTEPSDEREPTLMLDLATLAVHHVDAVVFKTEAFRVMRHRSTAKPMKPGSPAGLASLDDLDF